MARTFTNTADANGNVIVNAQGLTSFEYGTAAAVYQRVGAFDTATGRTLLTIGTEAQDFFEMFLGTNGTGGTNQDKIDFWNGTTSLRGVTAATADTWMCLAVSKATGTVTERAHLFNFAVGTWTHEAGTVTGADNAGTGATTHQIGYTGAVGGHVMAVACWRKRVLSDSEVERLPRGMWSMYDPDIYMCFPSGRDAVTRTTIDGSRNRMLQSSSGSNVTRTSAAGPAGFRTEPIFRRR